MLARTAVRRRYWHGRRAPALIVACFGVLLVGCTAGPDQGNVDLPSQNRSQWTLPLDEFTISSSPLRDYAEGLLNRECLADSGIDWPVPWQPTDTGLSESFKPTGRRLFNLDLATQWGYHTAQKATEDADAWREFTIEANDIAASTPGFEAIFDSCLERTREQIPLPSDDARDYALMASQQILAESLLSDPVTSAEGVWLKCMNDRGYVDLPASPNDMPPEGLREAYGVGEPGTSPGPDEIRLAIADAECAESSGYAAALYETEWDLQAEFLKKNEDRLIRIRTELNEDRQRLLTAVSQNAPKQ